MLEPILAPDLVDRVASRVRDAILEGSLLPGHRLIEEQLATKLDVSRAPIREALRILEHEGLVSASSRRGRVVARLSAADAWEVYSLRENLEAMAFGLLAGNLPPGLGQAARALVDDMQVAAGEGDIISLSQLDVQFHRLIVSHTNHRRLLRMWDGMANQIGLLSREVVATLYTDLTQIANRHEELLAVLEGGKQGAAREAIHTHIESVATKVIARLSESDGTQGSPEPEAGLSI